MASSAGEVRTSERGLEADATSFRGKWLGFAPPAATGGDMLPPDVILLFVRRLYKREPFLKRRPEVADPRVLEEAPAMAGGSS